MKKPNIERTQIILPPEMVKQIDQFLEKNPYYTTRTDFVKHCIRTYIDINNGKKEKLEGYQNMCEDEIPSFCSKMFKVEREDGKNEDKKI